MTPDEEIEELNKDWNMSLDLMDGYRKRWEDEKAETARLRAALASAIEERDEALKYRDFAMADKENIGFLKRLWEQECGYYRARWWASQRAEERSRRTIRALVAACRVTRLAAVGFAALAGVGPRRVRDEIRFGVNQAKKAERGQDRS